MHTGPSIEHHGVEGQLEYLHNKTHGGRPNNDGRTLKKYATVASKYVEVALDYQLDQIMLWYHGKQVPAAAQQSRSGRASSPGSGGPIDRGDVVAVLPISAENKAAVQQAYVDLDDNGNGVLDKDDFTHNVGLWAEIKSKLDDDHSGEIDNDEWTSGLTRVAMEPVTTLPPPASDPFFV